MSKRFDLEQEILRCWSIIDDLKVLADTWDQLTEDQKQNILLGLMELYELKFNICFNTFEELLQEIK